MSVVSPMTRLELEISNPCNEKCFHCYRHHLNGRKGFLSAKDANSVFQQAFVLGARAVTITGGEALLNPQWKEIVAIADTLGMRISLYTNGTLLTASDVDFIKSLKNLKEVQFSLYSLVPEVHDKITGLLGSCEKTKKAIQLVHQNGIPLFVSCPGMKENKETLPQLMEWCDEQEIPSCANIFIFGSSNYDGENLAHRLSVEDLEDYFNITMANNGRLSYLWGSRCDTCNTEKDLFYGGACSSLCLAGDGTIYPMIGWYEPLGNIHRDSLESIYKNHPLLQEIRNITIKDIPDCAQCTVVDYCDFCCNTHITANRGRLRLVDKEFCKYIHLKRQFILRRDEILQKAR